MTLKHQHQKAFNSISSILKKNVYIIPTFMLFVGFILGASFIKISSNTTNKPVNAPTTVSFLMFDGTTAHTWNGVTLFEGESVASIVDRIARTENVQLSFSGNGKDRQITSFEGKEVGANVWHSYINNAPLPTSIGRFYPKAGDAITLIYGAK